MKETVCIGCGNGSGAIGKNDEGVMQCVVCHSKDFKVVEITDLPKCTECGKTYAGGWTTIPFYNAEKNTFYCGCEGFN